MPVILRKLLGFVLLLATVGLATCQSMVKAETSGATDFNGTDTNHYPKDMQ